MTQPLTDRRRIGVRGVIVDGDKILAVKHKSKTGEEAKYWALPGGGLDPLESLEAGVARELYEELGIHAEVGTLLAIQQFPTERPTRDEELEFFFHITNASDFHRINLASTSHGLTELARVEFIDPRTENILPELFQHTNIAQLIAPGSPTLIKSYLE